MTQTCNAVYENGLFRPLTPLNIALADGQEVRLVVETEAMPADILSLAAQVYAGLTPQDVDDVERIALNRSPSLLTPPATPITRKFRTA